MLGLGLLRFTTEVLELRGKRVELATSWFLRLSGEKWVLPKNFNRVKRISVRALTINSYQRVLNIKRAKSAHTFGSDIRKSSH